MKKAAMICGMLLLILLLGAGGRYYMKNNGEKTLVYEKSGIVKVQTLKWGEIEKLTTYYKDGTKHIINYKNGVEDGEEITYYPNGNIKHKVIWKEGYRDHTKEAAEYYEDGSYKWISSPEGLDISYYENGQIKKECKTDEEGHKVGIEKSYNEEGELIAEGEYKDGKPYSGTFLDYDYNSEHEKIEFIETYNDGDLISTEEYEG